MNRPQVARFISPDDTNMPSNTGDLFWQDCLMPYYKPRIKLEKLCYKGKSFPYDGRSWRIPRDMFQCPSMRMKIRDFMADNVSNNYSLSNQNKLDFGFNSNCHSKGIMRMGDPSKIFMLMDMIGSSPTDHGASAERLSGDHADKQMWRGFLHGLPPRHGDGITLNIGYFDGHADAAPYQNIPVSTNKDTSVGSWAFK